MSPDAIGANPGELAPPRRLPHLSLHSRWGFESPGMSEANPGELVPRAPRRLSPGMSPDAIGTNHGEPRAPPRPSPSPSRTPGLHQTHACGA
jgi:hypothetical protein